MGDPQRTGLVSPARRWCAVCAWLLVAFQLVVAALAWLNRESQETAFLASGVAPNRNAAEGTVVGSIGVHVVLALACLAVALTARRGGRWTQVLGSIPLVVVAVGGVAALALPGQTWLSPVGVVLAVVALVLLWWPARATSPAA